MNSQTLLWTVELAALVGLGLYGIAGWLEPRRASFGDTLPAHLRLAPRRVFSPEERLLYERLSEALPQYVLLSKLPLVRFCEPSHPADRHYLHELLGSNHVGFAVCNHAGQVLATIDIDSNRPNRRRSFGIKQAALDACGIPYLRCPAEPLPTVAELRAWAPVASAHALTGSASDNVGAHERAPADATLPIGARAGAPPLAPRAPFRAPRIDDALPAAGTVGRPDGQSASAPESAIFQDPFFAPDSRPHGRGNEPDDGGGIVVDAPNRRPRGEI